MPTRSFLFTAAAFAALTLAACGGGGGSTPSTTISGSAVKGPVNGATVRVINAATGAVLGTTTTNASGAYTLSVPFTGDVVIEVVGGSYTDEATSATTTLAAPMRTVVAANGGTVTGVVTPLTTMAYSFAFGASGTPTTTAFNTMANNVATQFQLNGVNLSTTVPVVSGTLNDYGRLLAGLSKYMQTRAVSLAEILNADAIDLDAQFSTDLSAAYLAANPGTHITFSINNNSLVIAGTGAGGGSGSCGITVQGTITPSGQAPVSVPPTNFCVNGIAAASCSSGNASLVQSLNGQVGQQLGGSVNLSYTFNPTCAAGATTITLQ